MWQQIVVFIILGFAVAFLVKKYLFKGKKSKKGCGEDDCGCH